MTWLLRAHFLALLSCVSCNFLLTLLHLSMLLLHCRFRGMKRLCFVQCVMLISAMSLLIAPNAVAFSAKPSSRAAGIWDGSGNARFVLRRDAKTSIPFRQEHSKLQVSSSSIDASENIAIGQGERNARVRETNVTVAFPAFTELELLGRGDFVSSETFTIESPNGESHDFCVLLYPRGGGHSTSSPPVGTKNKLLGKKAGEEEGGFGMSYKVVPMFSNSANDKVGVYLKFLPKDEQDSVDVSFRLRLKGKQSSGPRFDVEWSAGMRFVCKDKSNLNQGLANDFGAHVMQSDLLPVFLGVHDQERKENEQDGILEMQVQTTVHAAVEPETARLPSSGDGGGLGLLPQLKDIRLKDNKSSFKEVHNGENVRVGKIVVPVLNRLSQRPRMFELGAYPGVEYRIMNIFDSNGNNLFASEPGATYEMRPIYPLVAQLEREWPIRIKESEIPKLFTSNMYNIISALGSVFTAAVGLTTAFVVSQIVSLFFIPSKSMDPTLQVGDVLLVDKLTPRVMTATGGGNQVGDMVLFSPPKLLQDIVKASGGKQISSRDLFVKRIAATSGDIVSVDRRGSVLVNDKEPIGNRELCDAEPLRLIEKYIQPMDNVEIPKDDVFVMGDCSSVSVDSRVWGPLPKADVVGRPLLRIWPLERFGTIPPIAPKEAVAEETTMTTE